MLDRHHDVVDSRCLRRPCRALLSHDSTTNRSRLCGYVCVLHSPTFGPWVCTSSRRRRVVTRIIRYNNQSKQQLQLRLQRRRTESPIRKFGTSCRVVPMRASHEQQLIVVSHLNAIQAVGWLVGTHTQAAKIAAACTTPVLTHHVQHTAKVHRGRQSHCVPTTIPALNTDLLPSTEVLTTQLCVRE